MLLTDILFFYSYYHDVSFTPLYPIFSSSIKRTCSRIPAPQWFVSHWGHRDGVASPVTILCYIFYSFVVLVATFIVVILLVWLNPQLWNWHPPYFSRLTCWRIATYIGLLRYNKKICLNFCSEMDIIEGVSHWMPWFGSGTAWLWHFVTADWGCRLHVVT